MSGTGAPWATMDDVRRIVREMIAGTRVAGFHESAGVRLVPPPDPKDCPDHGPAKEAASPGSAGDLTAPAPQRRTATEAPFGGEDEANRESGWLYREDDEANDIACRWSRNGDASICCAAEIRALVKREREAYAKELASFCDENGWSRTLRKVYLDAGFKGDPVEAMKSR